MQTFYRFSLPIVALLRFFLRACAAVYIFNKLSCHDLLLKNPIGFFLLLFSRYLHPTMWWLLGAVIVALLALRVFPRMLGFITLITVFLSGAGARAQARNQSKVPYAH
jgi:hypothetical protein